MQNDNAKIKIEDPPTSGGAKRTLGTCAIGILINQQKNAEIRQIAAKKRQNQAKTGKTTKNLTTFCAKQSQFPEAKV